MSLRDGENSNNWKGPVRQFLDKEIGTVHSDLDYFARKFKVLHWVVESLIEEKVQAFNKEHPEFQGNVTISLENEWNELWRGGPQRLVKLVVITGTQPPDTTQEFSNTEQPPVKTNEET